MSSPAVHMKRRKLGAGSRSDGMAASPGLPVKRLRGRRGFLQDVPYLPLELVCEIFCFLHPADLLRLLLTAKSFRHLLLQGSSDHIWKASLSQVEDLPECPSYMTARQYASLLFDIRCYTCGKVGHNVVPELRARFCGKCKDEDRQETVIDRVRLAELGLDPAILDGVVGDSDVEGHSWMFMSVRLSDVARFHRELDEVVDPEQRPAVISKQRDFLLEIQKHTTLYHLWNAKQKDQRAQERDILRSQRLESVKDKLIALGWEEELGYMGSEVDDILMELHGVRQPHRLTDRGWEKISPEVLEVMENTKARRLKRQEAVRISRLLIKLEKALIQNCAVTQLSPLVPCFADVLLFPEVRAFVEACLRAGGHILPDLAVLIAMLPALFHRWFEERQRRYAEYFVSSSGDPNFASQLLLATTTMWCTECEDRVFGDEGFDHPCLNRSASDLDVSQASTYETAVTLVTARRAWCPEVLRLVPCLHGSSSCLTENVGCPKLRVTEVITLCGQDPAHVTARQMDALETRLACLTCFRCFPAVLEVFTWRHAVTHTYRSDYDSNGHRPIFALVDQRDVQKAREAKPIWDDEALEERYCCALCFLHRNENSLSLTRHFECLHETESNIEENAYFDKKVVRREPILLMDPNFSPEHFLELDRQQLAAGIALWHAFTRPTKPKRA